MLTTGCIPRRASQPYGTGGGPQDYAIEVFYDGDCPLCRREINLLQRLDRHQRLRLTNIAAPDFKAAEYGRTLGELMAEMHGRLPNGEWVTGVETFRRIDAAVGCGWLAAATRLPGVAQLADAAYRLFAHNRLRLTGRCNDQCRVSPTA
ncbi:MAG: thiol-disulfide oxidoreductase DCC family protein [Planctomycetaceae bacterium]